MVDVVTGAAQEAGLNRGDAGDVVDQGDSSQMIAVVVSSTRAA